MEPSRDPADSVEALAALAPSARAPSARARLGVGAAIVLFIVALVAAVLISALGSGGLDETISAEPSADREGTGQKGSGVTVSTPDATAAPILFVHVWGAVSSAGLYELNAGARVVDVIAAAGGFADDADPAGVNLARTLEDGEQLYVPRIGEVPPPAVVGGAGGSGAGGSAGGVAAAGAPLNLNTATPAELETLPRIGPAMAQRMVEWREANGGFATVDDLRNISGIGEKTFEGLKDLVTT